MKNYDEIIDKTMCARCLEIKREQFPNTRCPWRSIDGEYCEKAQELADYIQELKERCSKSSYRDSWKNKFFKAQEEIERLTEENAILKGNPPLVVGRSSGKNIRAKLLAFDRMKEQNAELQKQVEELTEERYYTEQDTAKEIFNGIIENFVFAFIGASKDYEQGYIDALKDYDKQLRDFAKEEYGVEVE